MAPDTGEVASMWLAADAYDQLMGRWSRRVAGAFLEALDVPVGQRWPGVGLRRRLPLRQLPGLAA
ncbi:MAG TPA: hypothetical protein VMM13_03140 [Euzebya sp.]|nr:hypothetical protein [Euzebya sp.]